MTPPRGTIGGRLTCRGKRRIALPAAVAACVALVHGACTTVEPKDSDDDGGAPDASVDGG